MLGNNGYLTHYLREVPIQSNISMLQILQTI